MAVGSLSVTQGGVYLAGGRWVAGLFALGIGALLLLGFLTPAAGVLMGLGAAGIAFSWLPAPSANLQEAKLAITLAITMAGAITFLGPGAFSIDARMFGRREIVIPHIPRPPKP
jgi:uncharacterized membrane protein YphA (DoxX/SURF4 family)